MTKTRPTRILIYSYNYHPEPIGIAPLMTELAEGLVRNGYEVHVLTGMPNYPERKIYEQYRGKFYDTEVVNGVHIHRCYVWIRPKPGLVARMLLDMSFAATSFIRALSGWRPDVILLTVPPLPVSVPAALLGLIYRCPVVLNLQDILPEAAVHVGLIRNKLAIRVFEALECFAYRTAHTVSVITDGFVNNLVGKGVNPHKIEVIPNWVDINFITPKPKAQSQFREKHGLRDKFVVMYSGNIALTQGLETVIDTATRLREHPDIHFVIVGESKALEQLRQRCVRKDVVDQVTLLPFQPRAALPDMLAAADVGLIVQKHNVIGFNMPSKTQSLLASGRPIIASVPLTGTAASAVKRSKGGIVVKPESPYHLAAAILALASNPERAQQLGQNGRQHAIEQYSFASALSRYEALFELSLIHI